MIVKVQRSIYGNSTRPTLLVYNEDNSMRGQYWLNKEWAARFTSDGTLRDYKFFAEVRWLDTRTLPRFIAYAVEQDW